MIFDQTHLQHHPDQISPWVMSQTLTWSQTRHTWVMSMCCIDPCWEASQPDHVFTLTYMFHLLRSCSSGLGRPPLYHLFASPLQPWPSDQAMWTWATSNTFTNELAPWEWMTSPLTPSRTLWLRTFKTISVAFNMPHNGHGPASSTTGAPWTTRHPLRVKKFAPWSTSSWRPHLRNLTRSSSSYWVASSVNVRHCLPTTTKACDASGARHHRAQRCCFLFSTPQRTGMQTVPGSATTAWPIKMIITLSSQGHGYMMSGTWEIPPTTLNNTPTWLAGKTTNPPIGWWQYLTETTCRAPHCFFTSGTKLPLPGKDFLFMIRPWTRHLAPARSPRLLFALRRRMLYWNYNISRSGYLPKFHQILCLPRKVTLQHHQIRRLPRKMMRIIDCRDICNIIYNARSNRHHPPTSPNAAPAT